MDLWMWFRLDGLLQTLFLTKCEMVRRRLDRGYHRGIRRGTSAAMRALPASSPQDILSVHSHIQMCAVLRLRDR